MTERTPIPPVFLIEGLDVAIFASLEDAQLWLEPPDVPSQKGYDAVGRRLRIETDGHATRITLVEDEPSDSEQFGKELRAYLGHVGELSASDPACDLPCLIKLARGHTYQSKTFWSVIRSLWRRGSSDIAGE